MEIIVGKNISPVVTKVNAVMNEDVQRVIEMSSFFFKRNRQNFGETYTDVLEILYFEPKESFELAKKFSANLLIFVEH